MTTPKSEWQTKELATAFLKGVRGAIPGADLHSAVVGKIVQLWCHAPSAILDVGCGDGILGRFLLDIFPSARGVFVDFSEPMLDAVKLWGRWFLRCIIRAGVGPREVIEFRRKEF
jgi:SAM-dependent methyltransferase